jgi:hypothetical protein
MLSNNGKVLKVVSGGIITELPDVAVNGKLFKNLLPLKSFSKEYLSRDFILKDDLSYYDPFVLFGGDIFYLSQNDTFEIQFTVRKPSFSGSHNTVFGSVSSFYNNISLDFGNLNNGEISTFFGVPRSTSPNSWTNSLVIHNLSLTTNKWYTIKAVADENEVNLYIEDDDGLKAANPQNKNDLLANSTLQLLGINRYSQNKFNGEIDLKNSFIKKNGTLIWGCV